MKTTQVYDIPTRLFHWLFAGLFIASYFITKVFDDDSAAYPYHMILGLILALTVMLRIIWGIIGSRYARFSSFELRPSKIVTYFKNLLTSKTERNLGHNPASSWAALAMMGLALGLAVTGYMMSLGISKEFAEELHELFSDAFLVVAIAHVAGIIFHTLKHRDNIGLSMIHGKKESIAGAVGIEKSHAAAGLLFLVLTGAFVFHLNKNYDSNTRNLNFFGKTLQFGESENGEGEGDDDDDDDD